MTRVVSAFIPVALLIIGCGGRPGDDADAYHETAETGQPNIDAGYPEEMAEYREAFDASALAIAVAEGTVGKTTPFDGQYFQLTNPINMPQPVSQPHPPIIVGGSGEKKTLRLVAQYANACNLVVGSPCAIESFGVMARQEKSYADWLEKVEQYAQQKLSVLQRHCEAVGRPYEDIEKSIVTYINVGFDGMDSAEVVQLCRDLAELGFQYVIFVIPNGHEIAPLELLGREVIPIVSEMG